MKKKLKENLRSQNLKTKSNIFVSLKKNYSNVWSFILKKKVPFLEFQKLTLLLIAGGLSLGHFKGNCMFFKLKKAAL